MTLDSLDAINNKLPEIFASSGVAFVLVEHFPGTFANGAVFWFSKEKAVLMASIRYKWADIFWFNIFHEIGHLLLHPDTLILECKEQHIDVPGREAEADGFAAEHLIPTAEYNRFAKQNDFGTSAMKAFADKIGIHVGIVVGRLQHDQIISKNACLDLRRKYEWV
jgi:HTH-type transcriptional regulator/antitoxin HigA